MSSRYDAIDTWRRRHVKNEQDSGRQYLSGRIKMRELDLVVPPAVLQVNSYPAVTSGHATYNTLLMNKVRMRPDLSNLKSTVNGVTRHDIRPLPPIWLENWYFYIRINIDSKNSISEPQPISKSTLSDSSSSCKRQCTMSRSPQDVCARSLLSSCGYPLWTPDPSHQLLLSRPDGLRIGDVGVVVPEDGGFEVFFNICLPREHPFHRATGVPDNFKHVELHNEDIRMIPRVENPGRIISTSSVTKIRTVESPSDTSG